jgi:succinate-semialdehyde dehydrogenase/glutarate-semialdehyde dehydrogenase
MAIQTLNPATGEVVKTFKPHTEAEVNAKLDKAVSAYHVWRKKGLHERIEVIKKVAKDLKENREEYGKLITLEIGRPLETSISEVDKSVAICDYYIENAPQFLATHHVPTESTKSYIEYDPLGVILGVMPWNFPFTQAFRAIIPITIVGNTFVLKHASNVPQCSLLFEKIFTKYAPEGVMTSLLVEGRETSKIIADDRIAGVTVTGSEETGRRVAEVAGAHLKKSVLELGGSDAFIVMDDVDLEKIIKDAVTGRFNNAGQACNSPKRFILHTKIAKKFVELFLNEVKKMKVGDPLDPLTAIGPLAKEDLREELDRQVQESVKKGAKLLHGGKKIPGAGYFYEVTVLDHVKKGMPAYDEEIFGPVASMMEVSSLEEAIEVANDSHLGLSASIWTKDVAKAEEYIHDLHVGLVFINKVVRSDPRLPFGGVKKSGYGRELGEFGIKEFVNIKTVVVK